MATLVKQRLVFSGQFVEVYEYASGYLRDFKRKPRDDEKPKIEIDKMERLNRKFFSLSRCRQQIRRIVNANPDFKKFLTLTFADNVRDLDQAHFQFQIFLRKMRIANSSLRYIVIVEFQKRGAVHYHILCNLQYIKTAKVEKIWGNGFVKLNRISNIENVGSYVSKYLQKNILDERLNGRKAYFTSRKLTRPTEIVKQSLVKKIIKDYDFDNKTPAERFEFENEYTGKVIYKIFKLA